MRLAEDPLGFEGIGEIFGSFGPMNDDRAFLNSVDHDYPLGSELIGLDFFEVVGNLKPTTLRREGR